MTKISLIQFQKNKFSVFTPELQEKIKQVIKNQERMVLFINRKALATTVLCQDCGYVFKCSSCEVPFVLQTINRKRKLVCHHCGETKNAPDICPLCQSYKLKSLGIGTERVALELKKINQNIKFQLLFSEKENLIEILKDFNNQKYQFLITTEALFKPQLEKVPYVGVISIDNLLFLPDYKSEERVFLLLKKLLKITEKELIIQTIAPESKVFSYFIQGKDKEFFQEELHWRKKHYLPPYWQITKIKYRALSLETALKETEKAKSIIEERINKLKLEDKFSISQPVPAFIFKEKNQYHFYLFLKMKYEKEIIKDLSFEAGLDLLSPFPSLKEIKMRNFLLKDLDKKFEIDVDPDNLL